MNIISMGSVCSGIEAASVAWNPLGIKTEWVSEIADFPSLVLAKRYPNVQNLGDMINIPEKIERGEIASPDLICGGTPCQAFSFAGLQNGLKDKRGALSLKFIDIINSNDKKRIEHKKDATVVFWENVEGVLSDKTNAFGCFVSYLAGLSNPLEATRWPKAGLIRGPQRNVAWRVIDAKYFGVPQQRKRLYVLAGGKDFYPENILFELHTKELDKYPKQELAFDKGGHHFEIFREYTDCLYAAYGTKWNGNAAANNGSLFVVQDGKIRRLSPLECERLMGFDDGYTNISGSNRTNRYKAIGNSWAVPVIKWIGKRILNYESLDQITLTNIPPTQSDRYTEYYDLRQGIVQIKSDVYINCSTQPEQCVFGNMKDIVDSEAPDSIYISPTGCLGILRRSIERNTGINKRLEYFLSKAANCRR